MFNFAQFSCWSSQVLFVFALHTLPEETMRAKQMLATMSHEIRSPLSGVVSMAEILSTTKLDREQRHLLDVMLSSGDLVLQLINDILDLSKVESGLNFFPFKIVLILAFKLYGFISVQLEVIIFNCYTWIISI